MKIKNILVPTDFSDNAITAGAYAVWLADNYRAHVRFLHVVQPETGDLDVPVISAKGTQNRVEAAREVLEAYHKSVDILLRSMYLPRNQVQISSEVSVGTAASVIPEVMSKDTDLCVMGTRGKHNRLDHLFGSITTMVLHKARVPIFVIPPQLTHLGIAKAAYATELSHEDPIMIWRAAQYCKPFNTAIDIVHVSNDGDVEHETSLEELSEFLSRCIKISTINEIAGDHVGERLVKFAQRKELDLLVLHSQKRTWLERIWHPSVTRELALESNVPLLMIR